MFFKGSGRAYLQRYKHCYRKQFKCKVIHIFQKKAWLLASYPHEGKYRGSGCLTDENLSFLIKSVLDEKKQLIVSASGDAAVCQFIRCFEENIKEKSEEDLFRPILKNPFVVSKTQLKILKKNHVSLEFNIVEYLKHVKDLKREFGLLKFRSIMPIKKAKAQSIKYLFVSGENDNLNSLQLASICKNLPKQCLNRNKNQNNLDILKELIETSAYYSFDEVNKGSLENGMLANFVILENFDIENLENSLISETFFYGESIYKYKQKKKA